MKIKYFLLLFGLLILTVFFAWSQPGQYKIAGETTGFADSTMIYLDDLSTSSPVLIYGVSYYPTNFLIDKKGKIIARDITGEDLKKKLHELLD